MYGLSYSSESCKKHWQDCVSHHSPARAVRAHAYFYIKELQVIETQKSFESHLLQKTSSHVNHYKIIPADTHCDAALVKI